MSVPALIWAFRLHLPNALERYVLLELAGDADGAGLCFAAIPELSRRLMIPESATRDGLDALERARLIDRMDGPNGVALYRVAVPPVLYELDEQENDR